jgi:hypothetical protein
MGDQEFIQQMMDSLYPQLNTPGGSYYLPTFVTNNGYDPYGPFSWDLGQLKDPSVLGGVSTICQGIDISVGGYCTNTSEAYVSAAIPPNFPTLSLAACYLGGLRNVLAQRPIAQAPDGRTIIMPVTFGTIAGLPLAITINGNFTFTAFCCCSTDGTNCSGPAQPQVGTGTFSASMPSVVGSTNANCVLTFAITQLAQGVLTLVVQGVQFNPLLFADNSPNMTVTVDITSIPKGANQQSYSNIAAEAFNNAQARTTIVSQINASMNVPGTLATISDILTKEIDGFLQANHQYPFDQSSFALT